MLEYIMDQYLAEEVSVVQIGNARRELKEMSKKLETYRKLIKAMDNDNIIDEEWIEKLISDYDKAQRYLDALQSTFETVWEDEVDRRKRK